LKKRKKKYLTAIISLILYYNYNINIIISLN